MFYDAYYISYNIGNVIIELRNIMHKNEKNTFWKYKLLIWNACDKIE